MDSNLVEGLVTAAQRLELPEWERRDAREKIHSLIREQRDGPTMDDAERLTLLPRRHLEDLLSE